MIVPRPPSRESTSSRSTSRSSVRSVSSRASSHISAGVSRHRSSRKTNAESDHEKGSDGSGASDDDGSEANSSGSDGEDDVDAPQKEGGYERESISKEIEELKNEREKLMETINTRLRAEDHEKSRVIEEQKTLLAQFQDKLSLNESLLVDHRSELGRLRTELTKEKNDDALHKLKKMEQKEQNKVGNKLG